MTLDNSQAGGIVAGWYADPSSSERMRYWDGGAWTERTAPLVAPQQAEPVQQAQPVQPDATAELAPVADPAQEYGGGFVAVAPAAPLAQTPAAPAPSYSPAAYAQPVYAPAPAPATPTVMSPASMAPAPVVISAAESRPVDPELASSARRVATVFSVLALVVLILGIVSGLLVAAGGFLGESVTGTALLTPAAGLLSGVSTILTAVVLWAFWKLLALVARYIALRAE